VTTERASAVRRLAAAEATATQAFEEVGEMRDELADLRERLAQVPGPARPRATPAGVGGRAGGAILAPGSRHCECVWPMVVLWRLTFRQARLGPTHRWSRVCCGNILF